MHRRKRFERCIGSSFLLLAAACDPSAILWGRGEAVVADPLFRTDSSAYTLDVGSHGYTAHIGVEFTNRTRDTVFFTNCHGGVAHRLEKNVNGTWQTAWAPILLLCLSPPIRVPPGHSRNMPIGIFAGYPANNHGPKFQLDDIPGTYRAVWGPLHQYDRRAESGRPLPLFQRVSNTFTISLPTE
jgi:hypothetical protein